MALSLCAGAVCTAKHHKNSFLILYNCFLFCNSFLLFVRYLHGGHEEVFNKKITKNAITAIILLILRSFQRKGLCNSGLKAKSTTFVRNITTIRLRSQFVILKMDINMTDKIGKRRAANCVYHIGASIKDLGKKWFGFSKMEILTPDELVERINRE